MTESLAPESPPAQFRGARLLLTERDAILPIVRSVPPGDFDRPTVLPGWSVRDVLAHCAAALGLVAAGTGHAFSPAENQREVDDRDHLRLPGTVSRPRRHAGDPRPWNVSLPRMIADAYMHAATSAATLVADPAVAAAWSAPSALPAMSVGGLAAHLTNQIIAAAQALDAGPTDVARVPLIEHYARASWLGTGWDQETNTAIRAGGEAAAQAGPAAIATAASEALAMLSERLPGTPVDRSVRMPTGPWSLALDDFLVTRMMEIAVHSDDLAVSVRIPTPELPESVMVPVFDLLGRLSVRRHGQTPLLRALSRAERAPATISAL